MALFDPSKYEDDNRESFVAPKGQYPLYAHEQTVKESNGGTKYLEIKVTFEDGPRQGKWFYHRFFLWNPDADKRKKALVWFGNFCRAIDLGAFDPETEGDKMLNKSFIGDVDIEADAQYGDKNVLLPWGFHRVDGKSNSPKPSTSAPQSSGVSSGGGGSGTGAYEDDIPFSCNYC